MRWPNLFIVGAAKAGTTSLWKALNAFPDVYMSPLKEPHYFSQVDPRPEWAAHFPVIRSEREYLRLFAGARAVAYVGEASTSYLWSAARSADAIWDHSPNARIIAVLRDPIERAYSHYWNDRREGIESRAFETALHDEQRRSAAGQWGQDSLYIDAGRYSHQVQAFSERFKGQMLVLSYDDLAGDPAAVLHQHLHFSRTSTSAFVDVPERKFISGTPRRRRPIRPTFGGSPSHQSACLPARWAALSPPNALT